jgi:hypothetical protein
LDNVIERKVKEKKSMKTNSTKNQILNDKIEKKINLIKEPKKVSK